MNPINCWDFMKCGKKRECPAGTLKVANGFAGGINGGRGCVYIAGTFCSGTVQGTYQDKEKECINCDFYHVLRKENTKEMNILNFNKYIRANGS